MKSAEFAEFLRLYADVVTSPFLSLAEKTAVIEAAHDEYAGRTQPPPFRLIAQRLAALPPREADAQRTAPASDIATPPTAKRPPKGRVAGRSGR